MKYGIHFFYCDIKLNENKRFAIREIRNSFKIIFDNFPKWNLNKKFPDHSRHCCQSRKTILFLSRDCHVIFKNFKLIRDCQSYKKETFKL